MCGDFLKKRRAQRPGVYRYFMKQIIKALYKTEHKENATKTANEPISIKNDLLKATMSQRHGNYYGFVKTGFEKRKAHGKFAGATRHHLADFGNHFDTHRIFKGVPESTIFEKITKKKEKNEVREAVLKKYHVLIDF